MSASRTCIPLQRSAQPPLRGVGSLASLAAGLLLALASLAPQAAGREAAPTDPDLAAYHAARIAEVNREIEARGYHWTAGATSLTAYTPDELAGMLGLVMPPEVERRIGQEPPLPFPVRHDLPSSFDWRNLDGVTSVKNQGGCGSCWAFAGIGALEAVTKIYGDVEMDLSEQQILSCATPGTGCNGGWMATVWSWIRDHGAVTEACMPYQANDDVPCTEDQCAKVAATKLWIDIPNDVDQIKTAIYEYGPVATCFYVYDDFYYYNGGCYEHENQVTWTNHAVVIVGWDDAMCEGEGAWLIKNSWGEGWGLDGYFWIKYGNSNVGTSTELVYYYPALDLEFASVQVADQPSGDGDEWLDPGEAAPLVVGIKNALLAPHRTGIAAQLSCDAPEITILSGSATAPDLSAGQTALLDPPFAVTVSPYAAIGTPVTFHLQLTAQDGYAATDSFSLVLGDVPILLVDDDGSTVADPYVRTALDAGGYLYRHWDTSLMGSPTAAVLQRYPAVVWLTGISGRIDTPEQQAIAAFQDAGGALLATGQDIGWYLNDWSGAIPQDRQFYEGRLHAIYVSDGSGYMHLDGAPGDPIGDGLSFGIGGGSGSRAQAWPSWIDANAGAVATFSYAPGVIGAVRWEGAYRVAYFAFGIEAVNEATDRAAVIARTLDWLVPQWPDVQQPTMTLTAPNGGETWWLNSDVEILWNASDNVAVTTIDLRLSRDGGATYPEVLAIGLPNSGTFSWTVRGPDSEQCRVMAIARDGVGLMNMDTSNGDFTIFDPSSDVHSQATAFLFRAIGPNPFTRTTTLALDLAAAERVDLAIYDIVGRRLIDLQRGQLAAGPHVFDWQGTDAAGQRLPNGIYFARLARQSGLRLQERLVLVR